ncbi:hypothetical protein E1A91_D13G193100v1 [Gossypium mustelinum]|uniref:Uncharacterized protein n=1 Tax=Gossypium mustelinum TaxID=34275 RepID=A0A5D2S5M4_GOSMU|nr:hypothetical protein E1A91_D13G193100v1 [Gossypium mustelinum]
MLVGLLLVLGCLRWACATGLRKVGQLQAATFFCFLFFGGLLFGLLSWAAAGSGWVTGSVRVRPGSSRVDPTIQKKYLFILLFLFFFFFFFFLLVLVLLLLLASFLLFFLLLLRSASFVAVDAAARAAAVTSSGGSPMVSPMGVLRRLVRRCWCDGRRWAREG